MVERFSKNDGDLINVGVPRWDDDLEWLNSGSIFDSLVDGTEDWGMVAEGEKEVCERGMGGDGDTENDTSLSPPGSVTSSWGSWDCSRVKNKEDAGRVAGVKVEYGLSSLTSGLGRQTSCSMDLGLVQCHAVRVRQYKRLTSAKQCHVCARKTNLVPCSNIRLGLCLKSICKRCFDTFGWDLSAASDPNGNWKCPHCTMQCPKQARCVIYQRSIERRRQRNIAKKRALIHSLPSPTSVQTSQQDGDSVY